ncbi:precorrin-6y C5,15-methyltransferase (decarboxylating) subunit CbiE [uncultured Roseobacter sp.]|uniref:precorrin-6y C5,15-methyltransferase (decarboxylating) subunit CbiE n=1 Tax=uncultured Roseobacter sp. TaxID=114847 RepID=UPI002615FF6C|nr:precorrin-6y C5,15-methyltransferase (decarboxylating) subunit CbiE [uncultured Roseobacter sp.]
MSEFPWITIIGLGEDGPDGLTPASLAALQKAETIMGPPRHLALLPETGVERISWPVPFADGLETLAGFAGRQVAVLASGDPFWFGAGTVITRRFGTGAVRTFPAPSTFARAAALMGWGLEKTVCLGLHAAPLQRLRPQLASGAQLLVLLRDGDAVCALGQYLEDVGFGSSQLTVMEALGGKSERVTRTNPSGAATGTWAHPVCVAITAAGAGPALPATAGLPDDLFQSDGVMTKRAVRAMTLSALAPCAGERLWDIGGGSGSVSVEWLLAHPACQAIAIEPREDRIGFIRANARTLGVDRLEIVTGNAPDALDGLPAPDAVFVGGGLSTDLIEYLKNTLPPGTRVVANAVTIEAEALLAGLHTEKGGELLRLDFSVARPLGSKRSWDAAYPIVQWSGTL